MDNENVAVGVPAAYDPDVGVAGIEYKVAGDGLAPAYGAAIVVLGDYAAAVSDDVLAAALIVKCPVHKAGTVHAIGPVCAGGGAARRPYLGGRAPAGVPAEDKGLASPKIMHLSHQGQGVLDHRPALVGQASREVVPYLNGRRVGDFKVAYEQAPFLQLVHERLHRLYLIAGEAVADGHIRGGGRRDGDGQNALRVAIVCSIVRVCVRVVYALRGRGYGGHIPKDGPEPLHALRVQGNHVHAVVRGGGPGGKYGDHVPPARGPALDIHRIIPGLERLQPGVVFLVELRHGGG